MPTTRSLGLGLIVLGLGIGALIPVFLVAYPAAGITQANASNPAVVLPIFAANPTLVTIPAAFEIGVHTLGAVVLFGLWARFGPTSFLLACATLGGLVWMTLDIVDNAVSFSVVPGLATDAGIGSAVASSAFTLTSDVVDAIRFAGHFVGGLWMIGISAYVIETGRLSRSVGWLGIVVGAVFAANLLVPALLNVSFMTVPVWLILFGIVVTRAQAESEADLQPQMAAA